jgi:hypothetical protein
LWFGFKIVSIFSTAPAVKKIDASEVAKNDPKVFIPKHKFKAL